MAARKPLAHDTRFLLSSGVDWRALHGFCAIRLLDYRPEPPRFIVVSTDGALYCLKTHMVF